MKQEMHNITTDSDSGSNTEFKPDSMKLSANERRPVPGKSYEWRQSVETATDWMIWFRFILVLEGVCPTGGHSIDGTEQVFSITPVHMVLRCGDPTANLWLSATNQSDVSGTVYTHCTSLALCTFCTKLTDQNLIMFLVASTQLHGKI